MPPPLLEARNLTKKFPGVTALKNVNFTLGRGEIHALCGENGAGKSTLIKLLSGIHAHGSYEGELRVDGSPVAFRGIRDAEAAGIAVITQEFALVDELSVAENIFLGRAPTRGPRIDWLEMDRRAASLLQEFGLALDPETPVAGLGIGQKQLVEIVRALDKKSRVLVLDEPTAALTEKEVAVLLDHLRRLRAQGVSCIYISHKLDEVFSVADWITVLRDGASIATQRAGEVTLAQVIKHMVGREITDVFPDRSNRPEHSKPSERSQPSERSERSPLREERYRARRATVRHAWVPSECSPARERRVPVLTDRATSIPPLAVRSLTVAPAKISPPFLQDITFTLHPGEVLGFGGLMGAGRTELLMHLFGAWGHRLGGEVTLAGSPYPRPNPQTSIARGLVLASEDRRRYGLVLPQPVGFNLSLSSLGRFTRTSGRLDLAEEYVRNQESFDALRIKAPGQQSPAAGLSGGNQQKVVLGKVLMTEPSVVMLDEPTRGIDIGAKVEIYELIRRLTDEGKAVLLVSSELPELMGLSDRIIMLSEGRIGGEFERNGFSQEKLLAAAM